MTDTPNKSYQIIQEALKLDGTVETVKDFYAKWAEDYDADVSDEAYVAPRIVVKLLTGLAPDEAVGIVPGDPALEIIDAGCGTGLVGIILREHGYRHIDGFDLSPEMVEKAAALGLYRELKGDIDLTHPLTAYHNRLYDVAICCGVFTLGHAPPTALQQLIDLVKPGGLIILSTRTSYYDQSNYQAVSDAYERDGRLKLLTCLKDEPYTDDGTAHYWLYARGG
ncbi:MAG: class I SAM-dependent methyltransferase [Anaerolineae bacterium]|nr:class I SAM-dependent methyltransferase [Anaerolineae bacterium]